MLRGMLIYLVQYAVGFVAVWEVVKMTARSVRAALREETVATAIGEIGSRVGFPRPASSAVAACGPGVLDAQVRESAASSRARRRVAYIAERDRPLISQSWLAVYSPDS